MPQFPFTAALIRRVQEHLTIRINRNGSMAQSNRHKCTWPLLVVSLSVLQPAFANDTAEREQLVALARQLELIDRLAGHAANRAPQHRARYYFDHARLREDLQRVQAGIRDYLTPPRAQPRDPVELLGDYRQSDYSSDKEEDQ